MKVCLNTKDAFWCPSAYAKLSEYLVALIKKHQWVIQSPVGMSGGVAVVGGIPIYGKFVELTGEDVAEWIFQKEKCDVYMTVADVWWFNRIEKLNLPWVCVATIDYEEIPDFVVSRLEKAFAIIPTYRKLEKLLNKAGLETLETAYYCGYAPYFQPLDDTKEEILKYFIRTRTSMFGNADFGITIVAMNSRRKDFDTMFKAVRVFQDNNPDIRVKVWVHAMPNVTTEYDLVALARAHGIAVTFPDPIAYSYGFEEQDMVRIYNVSDCLLSLTSGESGNLVAVEAQACGVPVVATDYTINPEICLKDFLVPVRDFYYTPNPPLLKARADPYKAADRIEDVLNSDPDTLMKKCVNRVSGFCWTDIAKTYEEKLDEIEEMLYEKCVRPPTGNTPAEEVRA